MQDTKTLLLWLEGPLQSWGDRSRFGVRSTQSFPTKSGVWGMLFCALGMSGAQKETLAQLADCPMTVFSLVKDKAPVSLLTDFHMVGNGYDTTDPWENLLVPKTRDGKKAVGGGSKMTYRDYLQDAVFAVVLTVPSQWQAPIAEALTNPKWDVYLGRKSCAPSEIIYRGCFDTETEAEAALMEELNQRNAQAETTPGASRLRCQSRIDEVKTDGIQSNAIMLNDVPVAFGLNKEYRERAVVITWLES